MRNHRMLLMLLSLGFLLLGGCSDFDEMKSQRLWLNAQHLLHEGNEAGAEELLATLVARYPETRAADQALVLLAQFKTQRERERQAYATILDSYRNVFSAYRAVYGRYPRSVQELDRKDFLFDAAYLAEITPAGYRAYLLFAGEEQGFRVWCLGEGSARGFLANGRDHHLQPMARDQIEVELAAFLPLQQIGSLTILGRKP